MTTSPARAFSARVFSALLGVGVLLSIASTSGCAHPPWNPYKNWEIARTKHITAYSNGRMRLATTMDALEVVYSALHASFFKTKHIAPVEIVMLEGPEFERVFGIYREWLTVAKLPGHGLLGRRGVVVMQGLDHSTGSAAHRLTHLFLHAVAPNAPLWLHEGLAEYLESIQYRGDDKQAVACVGHLPHKAPEVELKELFTWTWAGYDDSKKAAWYRYTAASLVDYFLFAEKGALRDKFATFITEISDGTEVSAALQKVYPGLTIEALEKKARDHRSDAEMNPRGLCPIPFPIAPADFADSNPPRVEPAVQEDIEQLMLRLSLLPRRMGYVDWYPPSTVGLGGAHFGEAAMGR